MDASILMPQAFDGLEDSLMCMLTFSEKLKASHAKSCLKMSVTRCHLTAPYSIMPVLILRNETKESRMMCAVSEAVDLSICAIL